MSDLLDAFAAATARHPDRIALVEPDGTPVPYKTLNRRIEALSGAWTHLRPGARVLIALPLGADLYAALAALWSRGATAVLPEPATGLPGLRAALGAVPVDAMLTAGPYRALRLLPALWRTPRLPLTGSTPTAATPTGPDDLALISFTSGSTGAPKAIPRSHGFLSAQRAAIEPLLASDTPQTDLVAFPVFVLLNLAAGRTSVLPDWPLSKMHRATPDGLTTLIQRHAITRALLPPALCETLAQSRFSTLHTVFTGGGPVFPDLVDRLAQTLDVTSVYGSTEAEPIAHIAASDTTTEDRDAMANGAGLLAGPPAPGTKIRIEDGEIQVAGPHVVAGYLDPNRDASTKVRDGDTIWHRTGDAGRLDAQGRLWLLGRHGAQVGDLHPFAIEAAASLWPGIDRAALAPGPILAVQGDAAHMPDWKTRAAPFGVTDIRPVAALPMDRRHRSKIDRTRLEHMLR